MSVGYYFENYSNGYIVEIIKNNESRCTSWLLLPGENLWPVWLRAILYVAAMLYIFLGIAIASDVFMNAIEFITSTKRKVTFYDPERGESVTKEVYVWNETVANLTLMALGSSAPEILLAVIECVSNLDLIDNGKKASALGLFTIIGSAAFNMLIIIGICIISVPSPEFKSIKEFGVFCMTSFSSIWAYVWMLICAALVSPHVIEVWEAMVTFLMFPVLVVLAYCQDSGWWCTRCKSDNKVDMAKTSQTNVRVLSAGPKAHQGPTAKELHDNQNGTAVFSDRAPAMSPQSALMRSNSNGSQNGRLLSSSSISTNAEHSADRTYSTYSLRNIEASNEQMRRVLMRAKFRHAAIKTLIGSKPKPKSAKSKQKHVEFQESKKIPFVTSMDNWGRMVFSSPNYSVLESGGHLDVDVIFYRKIPLPPTVSGHKPIANGHREDPTRPDNETSLTEITGQFSIDYETREGTARDGHDYTHTHGTLTFKDNEYVKRIRIPIIDDVQYEADKDFYIILKNMNNGANLLGDPSVARVTIIDDDEPGVFSFEATHYHGNNGIVPVKIIRTQGSDGVVTLDITTSNGTAIGGIDTKSADFVNVNEQLTFKTGELQKNIEIKVNKNTDPKKNYVITLKNPSIGAKIGDHSGAVCYIGPADNDLDDKLADYVQNNDEEEDPTWKGQIIQAMSIETEEDEDGNKMEPKALDLILHFCTFFFKFMCALLPPRKVLGAYPLFVMSLLVIGMMTAFVEQLGNLLGCVVGLKTAVTGITIVAIGTSLPDTFASRTAAMQDDSADNSIGNVTGSNSVNVFLGLGLPWTIASVYAAVRGKKYCVDTNNLFQSLIFFLTCAIIAIIILFFRRGMGGELGGPVATKWVAGITFMMLWVIYVILASLKAYDILDWNPSLPESVCN